MITRATFEQIDNEVRIAVEEAFNLIKEKCIDHDYVIYLADGEYHPEYENSWLNLNPHTIDDQLDHYKDESRLGFFIQFMRLFYRFANGENEVDDNEFRLTMELMIYTHIWESKKFLKQLFRLSQLSLQKSYPWSVTVPAMSKHDFLRFEVRDAFGKRGLKVADIITKGFHTSLRNAFAHSEYSFDSRNKLIHLDTYKGASWDIARITYDEWSVRFAYSSLLSYHFLNKKAERRRSLVDDFKKEVFLIILPINKRKFRVQRIRYEAEWDRFIFERT